MSDALPYTPDDIAAQSIAAAEAGASILHLHARDPKDGRPTPDPAVFMQFLPRIKQSTDAVINITTGGGLGMTVEQRLAAPLVAKPEMCSLNMGSMNFAIFPLADRYKTWKFDWEEPYLRGTDDFIFRNTFHDIERILKMLGEEHGTRFEHECYDVGHLYNLAHFVDRKPREAAVLRPDDLRHPGWHRRRHAQSLVHEGDRRPPVRRRLPLVSARGRPLANSLRDAGGDDGRERARWASRTRSTSGAASSRPRTRSRSAKIRRILEELGHEIATPAEAREMLALKGGDNVRF